MSDQIGQSDSGESVSTGWITGTVLAVALAAGAGGAPLVGALREGVQKQFGIPFWLLGAGVAALGLAAGILGVIINRRMPGIRRTELFRGGLVLSLLAFGLYCFIPTGNYWAVAALSGGWFVMMLGRSFMGTSNAIFADLWHHSPRTGVILMHAVNAIGKVVAPVLALIIGVGLQSNAIVYGAVWFALTLVVFTWPRKAVAHLGQVEHSQHAASRSGASVIRSTMFWVVCIQFGFIAGSEAGVASTLPSFIEKYRGGFWGLSPRNFSQLVLVAMLMGIVVGRFVALRFSGRTGERGIIKACLLCTSAAIPAVLHPAPAVFLPCFFVLGIAFSATWPAFFAQAVEKFRNDKTVLSLVATVCTIFGVNGFMLATSLIGNNPANLPWAVLASAGGMAVFAVCFFALDLGGSRKILPDI